MSDQENECLSYDDIDRLVENIFNGVDFFHSALVGILNNLTLALGLLKETRKHTG